jgi:hypothetical protein
LSGGPEQRQVTKPDSISCYVDPDEGMFELFYQLVNFEIFKVFDDFSLFPIFSEKFGKAC